MAYKETDFQVLAGLNDIILYGYKSSTDSISTISIAGYFPSNRFYTTGASYIFIDCVDSSGLFNVIIDNDGHPVVIKPNLITGVADVTTELKSSNEQIVDVVWNAPLLNTNYIVQANITSDGAVLFNTIYGSKTTEKVQFKVVNIGKSIVNNIIINATATYN